MGDVTVGRVSNYVSLSVQSPHFPAVPLVSNSKLTPVFTFTYVYNICFFPFPSLFPSVPLRLSEHVLLLFLLGSVPDGYLHPVCF